MDACSPSVFGAACSEGPAAPSGEDTLAVSEVGIVELQPAPLAVIRDLPGRVAPTRIAEVRAGLGHVAALPMDCSVPTSFDSAAFIKRDL